MKKPIAEPRNTTIAKACGRLAGLASNLGDAAIRLRESRDRIAALHKCGLLTAKERVSLDKIDAACMSALIELEDYHPVPKEIEASLTKRERE